jgi:hypothetical protein
MGRVGASLASNPVAQIGMSLGGHDNQTSCHTVWPKSA